MTEHSDISEMARQFAAHACDYALPDADILSIEKIVSAILSEKHSLSPKDSMVFEKLLDEPGMDGEKQQEFWNAVWNIVVCIIDFKWEQHLNTPPENSGGKESESDSDGGIGGENMLLLDNRKSSETQDQAAAKKLRRKGSHDSE